jgi:hypothetical protein
LRGRRRMEILEGKLVVVFPLFEVEAKFTASKK